MLEEKIFSDYKEAMKSKDALKSSALSFLRAELNNVATAKKKKGLDDKEVVLVIRKQVKARQDSIEQFKKGNRQDLVDKEARELEILKAYLPAELPPEKIKEIIEEVITALGAIDLKDMGKVMKEVNAKVAGEADGKIVSALVKERLVRPAAEPKGEPEED
ncbi:GatB/YqeY domain-containing protein [Candidatus Omnitrophota bacterium]